MQNYYEMLGVPHDATPSVVKIAYEGKVKALGRSGLSEAEREREDERIRADRAYRVQREQELARAREAAARRAQ